MPCSDAGAGAERIVEDAASSQRDVHQLRPPGPAGCMDPIPEKPAYVRRRRSEAGLTDPGKERHDPMHPTSPRLFRALAAGLLLAAGVAGTTVLATGSDHQDTPDVELNPKMDMTDIYAFPSPTPGRIVLVMDTRAFLTPAQAADPVQGSFDPNLLYQFKIDNNGDYTEDRVIQVTFSGEGSAQQVQLRGP